MRFNELISQTGEAMGISQLRPNALGSLSLSIDGKTFTIKHFENTDQVFVVYEFEKLPSRDAERSRAMEFFLKENCFYRGVGGGIIGLKDDVAYYTYRTDLESLTPSVLLDILKAVVETCFDLEKRLFDVLAETESVSAEGFDPNGIAV